MAAPPERAEHAATIDDLLSGALGHSSTPSTRSAAPQARSGHYSITGSGGLGISGVGHGGAGYGVGLGTIGHGRAMPSANTESYARVNESDFVSVHDQPLSTFSIDVDTASYSNVRRFLDEGTLPPPDAVRVEEMLNYFHYRYDAPSDGRPFSVTTEVASAPWAPSHRLLLVGLQARTIREEQTPPRNLVFLVDVSGSMQSADRLPLLKRSLIHLAARLREEDRIGVVVYAGASGVVLPTTHGSDRGTVIAALDQLEAGGSTNGAEGIELAYQMARRSFIRGGVNRVILATDGDFNVGVTSEGGLTRLIERERESGVFLSVLGVGRGNLKDSTMEALADRGNGNYAYIDTLAEGYRALVTEAGSTLVTVAKDVKLQLELNPAVVDSYRLIGYDNRRLAARDFNDDRKDAGEMGAGHSVTALYEIIPRGAPDGVDSNVDPLRYQAVPQPTPTPSTELATVKVRYKAPDAHQSTRFSRVVHSSERSIQIASENLRWAAAVASFGMLLSHSEHRGGSSFESVLQLGRAAVGDDTDGYRKGMLQLVTTAHRLSDANAPLHVAR